MQTRPQIHFAHANGFPAGTYLELFKHLNTQYEVFHIDKMAHNPDYPINDHWESTADEIIAHISNHTDEPVIGIGHSFGSLATLQAAHKRPELFSQIILLDPPLVMGPFSSALLYVCKKLNLMDKITPAGKSKYRRTTWEDDKHVFDYFRSKHLFHHFSDKVLRDYINAATHKVEDGSIELHYDVKTECDVFRTMPHNLECKRTPLKMPATLIYGKDSHTLKLRYAKRLSKRQNVELIGTKGGHLFPLEHPEQAAQLILKVIQTHSRA